jgi:hypothetical protein
MKADFVRPLYQGDGDWVSVYLETSWGPKDAADRTALHWRGARHELQAAGADQATLEAVTERRSAPGCAVFARGGAVALARPLPAAPAPRARLAPLPDVLPMLAQVDDDVRYLQVEARRDGGEIATAASSRGTLQEPAGVQATEWPVHKVRTGGLAQKQHQRSAEEAWEENAKELASALTEADRQQRPRFIVIAGDVKARNLLLSHLPVAVRDRTVVIDRELTAGSQELASAAQAAISDQLAMETGQHLDRWREMLGHDGAVEGLAETVAALRNGVAAEVLLHPGFDAGQLAWIGPGSETALTEAALRERGTADPQADLIGAAVARAAACTDAELWFVPGPDIEPGEPRPPSPPNPALRDGIGAILRAPVSAVNPERG